MKYVVYVQSHKKLDINAIKNKSQSWGDSTVVMQDTLIPDV